ncbi:sugar ABC transporter permease [Nakamurella multipartita]|jgi:arabinogalactan oligomer/maltooligosaccharide transport system permease protein|uniref:Binding-protein-dependent transport systems inner membrane component n=1 Tax=Nakamurella multipartita (strain ATCC 700099 / DSM 44233 / CIP 104796 / JCM 9543 / NBRC 105858 / Y-104) TaxID=479431 RepID=C8X7V8_NAKMY|nr:sugar ABC transporter permease [Nakamurella multipartita]ACV80961.1 binding-protein-dependent transport systems inner membrane component [Nakamurella multipartita DSM 44233]HOZ59168.1 sugar ABC transporter permease [Nakamurella multipartita]
MSVDTSAAKTGTEPKIKADKMPFGRWMRIVGWRHIVAIIMVIWALFPALYVINLAFSGGNTLTAACPPSKTGLAALTCLLPSNFSLDNFTTLLSSSQWPFAVWFRNTLLLAVLNSFLALFMGAAAAFAFSRLRFKGRRMGLLTLMLVQMFPAVLALTAIFILLQQIGDVFPALGLRSVWGLLLVYLGGALGVNTFLMKGYFDTIPVDIDESARIDGAGHVKIFFGLIMRLALPILVVVFFVSFTATFNELPLAQQILPDPDNTTLAVGLRGLVADPLRQQWGLMAAGGLMAAVPMLIVFGITQRSLTTGLTAGAVKG